MSYIPNMPLAAYAPAPTAKTGATLTDYPAVLPPLDMDELQMELGYLLGTERYTQLGEYGSHFTDPRVAGPLARFRDRLAVAGETIAERNLRRTPHEQLAPSSIPQSINI
jgi:arachidonate 15-lipoxygenase